MHFYSPKCILSHVADKQQENANTLILQEPILFLSNKGKIQILKGNEKMKNSKTLKKILAVSLIMILTLCTLTACGGNDADTNSQGDEMTTLVFGTSADYAPFEFMYPDENGEMVYGGIDVEVAQYIAD